MPGDCAQEEAQQSASALLIVDDAELPPAGIRPVALASSCAEFAQDSALHLSLDFLQFDVRQLGQDAERLRARAEVEHARIRVALLALLDKARPGLQGRDLPVEKQSAPVWLRLFTLVVEVTEARVREENCRCAKLRRTLLCNAVHATLVLAAFDCQSFPPVASCGLVHGVRLPSALPALLAGEARLRGQILREQAQAGGEASRALVGHRRTDALCADPHLTIIVVFDALAEGMAPADELAHFQASAAMLYHVGASPVFPVCPTTGTADTTIHGHEDAPALGCSRNRCVQGEVLLKLIIRILTRHIGQCIGNFRLDLALHEGVVGRRARVSLEARGLKAWTANISSAGCTAVRTEHGLANGGRTASLEYPELTQVENATCPRKLHIDVAAVAPLAISSIGLSCAVLVAACNPRADHTAATVTFTRRHADSNVRPLICSGVVANVIVPTAFGSEEEPGSALVGVRILNVDPSNRHGTAKVHLCPGTLLVHRDRA
mmetsp:Transcript_70227/g.167762  ORF Transcript_70227/g.167762 Transcript_70227/m.167762 type:complete len:493 (+) Transcript_70227:3270-4748(+)